MDIVGKQRMLAQLMMQRSSRELLGFLISNGWHEKTGVSISEATSRGEWVHPEYPFIIRVYSKIVNENETRTRVEILESVYNAELE